MIKKAAFIGLFIFTSLCGNSQQFFFTGYSINNGLSQSVVNCIFQDSKGYIWIGTQNGLNRFNGYTFEVFTYKPNDSTTISNNWIYAITEDREGNLWIGTKGGLNKFIRKEKQFRQIHYSTPYTTEVTNYVYDVRCARNGNILINTPPLLTICEPGEMKFSHHISPIAFDGGVKDNNIPLMEDAEGNIWVGSSRGLTCFNLGTGRFQTFTSDPANPAGLSDNIVTALFEGRRGEIWIGTSRGLNKLQKSNKNFTHYYHDNRDEFSLGNDFIRALLEDKTGNLWIATEGGGLNRMDRIPGDKVLFEHFTAERSSLNHNIVLSLVMDRSDNLWIGTLSGINKTDLKKQKFNLYRKSDSPYSVDLAGNVIASIYKDEKNVIWIGNWGQGLNLFDRKSGRVEHYSSRLSGKYNIPNDFVHTIFEDATHTIWLGTRDGLVVYQKEKGSFARPEKLFPGSGFSDFSGLRIFMMIQDHRGDYWVATQDGLFRMKPSGSGPEHFHVKAPPDHRISSNMVYAVHEDRQGLIWIGTIGGLDVFDPRTSQIKYYQKKEGKGNSLADNFVTALCEDHNGDIWIGTNSYLNRFSGKDSTFKYYSQEQGLPSNLVYSIIEDNSHGLWLGTGNGLCLFDSASGTFRTYTVEEGLQSPEFNLRAACKSRDGEVFFGGMNGFNSFYPDSLKDNSYIPAIAITSAFKVSKGAKEYLDPGNSGGIVLNYNENSFTVEFAALEFTNPARNRYAYKLEGIDDDWIDIGTRNFVPFSNLPAGEYTLWVKGSNNDGRWNETGVSLKIIIRPPWWRSNLAYVAYIIIVIFVVYVIVKRREHHHLQDRKMLEDKVKERTLQIEAQKAEIQAKNTELNELNASKDKFFSIIAHDLRNPFNAIIGLTDVLLMGLPDQDPASMQKTLENIRGSSQQAHELLENLLLWARSVTGTMDFKPVPVDLKAMVEENIELVSVQADRKNISIHADFTNTVMISGDMNMINTILRNLLTNALKFTRHNGEVKVRLSEKDGYCELSVIDNGIGIPADKFWKLFSIDTSHKTKGTDQEPGTGLGLILCNEFVMRHGGRIEVDSEIGKGTEFRVILPKVQG